MIVLDVHQMKTHCQQEKSVTQAVEQELIEMIDG